MPRPLRSILFLLACLALTGLAVAGAAALPRLGAIRCLLAFQEPAPDDLEDARDAADELVLLEDEARYGARRAWFLPGRDEPASTIVFVHGVTAAGLEDGRIVRAIRAFGCSGSAVIAPEVPRLVDPLDPTPVGRALDRCLDALAAGRYEGTDPRRVAVVGISVGGALALRAAARFRERGGGGLRALLLVGAPDDMRRAATGWFAAPDAAEVDDDTFEWDRRHAAGFARRWLIRAGLIGRFGDRPEVRALDAWLGQDPVPKDPPEDLRDPALLDVATRVRAAPDVRADGMDEVLRHAADPVEAMSPAAWDDALAHLAGVPVFLLHGHGDPLVAIAQGRRLRERLARRTLVSWLPSHMMGHADVGEAGLAERIDHVTLVDDVFDIIGR